MSERREPTVGATFSLEHPFVRSLWGDYDEEGPSTYLSWKPGVLYETTGNSYDDYTVCHAHGVGQVHYTVVDVHRLPRPWPARIFYTRKWTDPDGRTFGKRKLLMTTIPALRRRINESGMVRLKVEEVEDLSDAAKAEMIKEGVTP